MSNPENADTIGPNPNHLSAQHAQDLQEVTDLIQAGRVTEAHARCEKMLAIWPDNLNVLIYLANIQWNCGLHAQAEALVSRGLQLAPDHLLLHLLMGDIAKSREDTETAMFHFREVIRLEPDNLDGHYQYGVLLINSGRNAEAIAEMKRVLEIKPDMAEAHQTIAHIYFLEGMDILGNVHVRLHDHYNPSVKPLYPADEVKDTLFLDSKKALMAARVGLQTLINMTFPARQLCFHFDQSLANEGLETLVCLSSTNLVNTLVNSRLRLPVTVDFSPDDPEQIRLALMMANIVGMIKNLRVNILRQLFQIKINQKPDFVADRPWRVYVHASRWTTVMQYAARNVAQALERLGCEVHFEIENNDLELLSGYHTIIKHYSCNPHITININHCNNSYLHPDVFNIVWYQDPMSEIEKAEPLPWRERDIVMSAYPEFDEMIRKTGVQEVLRQDLCADLNCFYVKRPRSERRKVVFLGSSHHYFPKGMPGEDLALGELREMVEQGMIITPDHIQNLRERTHLPFIHLSQYLYPYLVRNRSVEWLCELAPELEWEVEVYGRYWEEIPIVAPFYRGQVPHGPAVADIYNQARYALAAHPQMVKSQRLAEIAACGCIPVLFDDRLHAEGPHWDDEILFFKTKAELRTRLQQEPKNEPTAIAQAYSYDLLAQRILRMVDERL